MDPFVIFEDCCFVEEAEPETLELEVRYAYVDNDAKVWFLRPEKLEYNPPIFLIYELGVHKTTESVNIKAGEPPVVGTVGFDYYGNLLKVVSVEWV